MIIVNDFPISKENIIDMEIGKDYYNIAQERINNTKYNEVI